MGSSGGPTTPRGCPFTCGRRGWSRFDTIPPSRETRPRKRTDEGGRKQAFVMTFWPSPSTGGLSMLRRARFVLLSLLAAVMLALPASAGAGVAEATSTHTYTKNMHPLGFSERAVPLTGTGSGVFNSDIAFWGKMAVHGSYEGFRLIDISDPEKPVQIVNYTDCVRGMTTGNQGDVIVWDDILVRSWNSPPTGDAMCGGILTPAGQEGLHVFDIS